MNRSNSFRSFASECSSCKPKFVFNDEYNLADAWRSIYRDAVVCKDVYDWTNICYH